MRPKTDLLLFIKSCLNDKNISKGSVILYSQLIHFYYPKIVNFIKDSRFFRCFVFILRDFWRLLSNYLFNSKYERIFYDIDLGINLLNR